MKKVFVLVILISLFTSQAFADIGWFVAPYVRISHPKYVRRACGMVQFSTSIAADGGMWREVEILGDKCVVKVKASAATLTVINNTAGFTRLPKDALTQSLSSLTAQQKTNLRNFVLGLGYTLAEIQAVFPNDLGTYTLSDVVKFMARRRLTPRYDNGTNSIILDGVERTPESIDLLEVQVQ